MVILALSLIFALFWLTGCSQAKPSSQSPNELVIAHTNDIEGALRAVQLPQRSGRRSIPPGNSPEDTYGHPIPTVILLDGGDSLYGTPASDNTNGLSQVAVMNALQYDAAVLGDKDFNYGFDELKTAIETADFPFLSANILRIDNNQPLTKASTIISRNGQKIAVIGFTSPNVGTIIAADQILSSQIKVEDPIAIAQKLIPELQKQADVIIVLSHLGINLDRELAARVKGISIIIGAHNRKMIAPPEILENDIPVVQVGYQGDILGVEKITYSGIDKPVKITNENITLDSSIESDKQMSALIAHFEALAAWNGNTSFADAIGATYPLDVARASLEVKKAYGITTAYPELVMQSMQSIDPQDSSITLQKCFINALSEKYQIDYSLVGVTNKNCLTALDRISSQLTRQPAGTKIVPDYWSVD